MPKVRTALTLCALALAVACAAAAAPAGRVRVSTVIAGASLPHYGGDDGPASAAGLAVAGIAVDRQGAIYVADVADGASGTRIRKISPNGSISTVGGGGTNMRTKEEPASAATARISLTKNADSGAFVLDGNGDIFVATAAMPPPEWTRSPQPARSARSRAATARAAARP